MSSRFQSLKKTKNLLPILLIVGGLGLAFSKPIYSRLSPASLDVQIERPPIIMPAAYKVYADENALEGKYSLFKMLVTNNSSNTARNVEVAYEIPGYIERKVETKIPVILPGQSVVVNCYPTFNEKIVEKTTPSKEKVNIYITGSGMSDIEKTFAIDIKGRNEFMYTYIPGDEIRTAGDFFDNMDLLSCYVTPEDPIIKYYTQKIQEKVLKGETASVTNSEKEGVRFMTGIYYATLISNMVYSGTSGVPAKIDDVSSIVQSMRLPREVVTGKTGLCIELTLLYASIMMNAGMDPIIYLVPGHAYPGFRMNGNYYAIESTGIGGDGMGGRQSTEQALQAGMKQLEEFFKMASAGDDRYRIVDVRESIKNGAVAMELKDDTYLRQKVDEIARSFEVNNANVNVAPNTGDGNGGNYDTGNDNGGGNTAVPSGYTLYQGNPTFAYPSSWKNYPKSQYSTPQLKQILANSSNTAYLEVYEFNGFNNPEQAIMTIQQNVSNNGGNLQYKVAGQSNGYHVFNGQTSYSGGSIIWIAAFKQTNEGVVGIAVGANSTTGTTHNATIMKILNTLR